MRPKPAGPGSTPEPDDHRPEGFGFRTGVRSAAVATGFAVFVLVIGTVLVAFGAIIFMGEGQWGAVWLLLVLELFFIAGFAAMLHMARQRRRNGRQPPATPVG
ncbi:hypothetical protein [Arthrobacter sulfonylureivorans]|uniref:Uncharacterized protein n=1 Tax=Arthrobacter sulfonylureivorans TaxID=2486855 RepID=A0ABY3WAA0_9MICC|nr:hypothetical protein [Arthrobacter sulfonylureivorans]UNK47278.1 hypothetical protein MNQ99_08055 [Arthrobacter sulfonylureivorans]